MADIHDFDGTVVAVFDDLSLAEQTATEVSGAGYDYELLHGEEGLRQLDPAGESGPRATIKRLVTAFGDQFRIAERLGAELGKGGAVISVDARSSDADEAVRILQKHGGEFIWKLGDWTYTQVED